MKITDYQNYVFIFAHPDDELYVCAMMRTLIEAKKVVSALFITSGDAGGNALERERAIITSMSAVGVDREHVSLLGFSESKLLQSFPAVATAIDKVIETIEPDCIVGMDYEGGHEGHDSASFMAARAAEKSGTVHYVYPEYHAVNGVRKGAEFMPGHGATDTLELDDEDIDLKIKVLQTHHDQLGHFLNLQRRDETYFPRVFQREVFMHVNGQLDYSQRPADEIGYESHRNGYKYSDFEAAVRSCE